MSQADERATLVVARGVRRLREATKALVAAIEDGELQGLEPALGRQSEAFEDLKSSLGDAGPLPHAMLSEWSEAREEAVQQAGSRLAAIRRELDQIRRARTAARRMGSEEPSARFVSRHA